MMKAREALQLLDKAHLDPNVKKIIANLCEEVVNQRQALSEMANHLDQMTILLSTVIEISSKLKTTVEKLPKKYSLDKDTIN